MNRSAGCLPRDHKINEAINKYLEVSALPLGLSAALNAGAVKIRWHCRLLQQQHPSVFSSQCQVTVMSTRATSVFLIIL